MNAFAIITALAAASATAVAETGIGGSGDSAGSSAPGCVQVPAAGASAPGCVQVPAAGSSDQVAVQEGELLEAGPFCASSLVLDGTLVLSSEPVSISAISGCGTLVSPFPVSAPFSSPSWRGVFRLHSFSSTNSFPLSSFANASSTLSLSSVSLASVPSGDSFPGRLHLAGDLEIRKGFRKTSSSIASLSGPGALRLSLSTSQHFAVADASSFSGSIDNNGAALTVGSGEGSAGTISVGSGSSISLADGAFWRSGDGSFAEPSVRLRGTLHLQGAASILSPALLADGSSISLDSPSASLSFTSTPEVEGCVAIALGAAPAVPRRILSWPAAPGGSFTLAGPGSGKFALKAKSDGLHIVRRALTVIVR